MRCACLRACRSEPQMPQASDLTSTCPRPVWVRASVDDDLAVPENRCAHRRLLPVVLFSLSTENRRASAMASPAAGICVRRSATARRNGQQLRPPHPLAMGGVESAGDDEGGAGDRPDVGHFAENQEAEDADPQQLRVGKRRQHRRIGIAERQHHDPLPRRRRHADEDAEGNLVPARRHPDERHQRGEHATPAIDE